MNDLMSAMRPAKSVCVELLLLCSALWAQNQQAHGIRNIVLVHGAWADGSGWKRVYDTLVKDGYKVGIVQEPVLNSADNFKAVITTAAWRSKPSWMLVAGADRTINPELERWYATRAESHKVEVAGDSHVVYISRPKEVAALIEQAASQAR